MYQRQDLAALRTSCLLQRDSANGIMRNGPRNETEHGLAHTGSREIFWCCDVDVVTGDMLDLESAIRDHGEQSAADPSFDARGLVDQLMCRIDGDDAADQSDRDTPSEHHGR